MGGRTRRRDWEIPVALERSIRFIAGIGGFVWEMYGEARWQALVVCTALAGLSIANLADDVRVGITGRRLAEEGDVE